jgi:catechol 2,3-dioxygenase-like lactoylglutathione lyase family enzyme
VITAAHLLIYSDDEAATRAFLRDVLELPNIDVHEGWLIFKAGSSELAVHPASGPAGDAEGGSDTRHEITLMCDDLGRTVSELTAKGAEFIGSPSEQRWGTTTMVKVPGAGELMLYQPKHLTAYDL